LVKAVPPPFFFFSFFGPVPPRDLHTPLTQSPLLSRDPGRASSLADCHAMEACLCLRFWKRDRTPFSPIQNHRHFFLGAKNAFFPPDLRAKSSSILCCWKLASLFSPPGAVQIAVFSPKKSNSLLHKLIWWSGSFPKPFSGKIVTPFFSPRSDKRAFSPPLGDGCWWKPLGDWQSLFFPLRTEKIVWPCFLPVCGLMIRGLFFPKEDR